MFKRSLILFAVLLLVSQPFSIVSGQEHYYATLSQLKERSIAMGGAFTSVEDGLPAILYNPGTMNLYRVQKDFRITLFANPLLSYVGFHSLSDGFRYGMKKRELLQAFALLLKGISISGKSFEAGFLFGEGSLSAIYDDQRPGFFNYRNLFDHSAHTIFTTIKLAHRVSIGLNGTYYRQSDDDHVEKGYGFSYGILLKPNEKVNVGLAYISLPAMMSDFRMPLERMMSETMNIGISYKLFSSTIFSLDIRNLTEENKSNVRELHLGMEQHFFHIAAIRMGFYNEKFTENRNYSCGFGLLDTNLFFKEEDWFDHHDYLLNYAYVYEEKGSAFNRWHFLSFLLRF